ncbi:MAG TPA: DUF1178 family protein [Sphingobium sp.]
MIVFDLKCIAGNHVFEGWFGSSEDFESQKVRGLLCCPVCGSHDVAKAVMAPAVPAKSNRQTAPVPAVSGAEAAKLRAMMEKLAQAQSEALKDSEWVGRGFAETARAMHYGEKAHKSVHGEVAPDEARALIEEGVEVTPLPFPIIPPDVQN